MVTNNSCDYAPTQYNIQTGGANGTLNNVAPSATSGVPVISQGAASQPIFGTALVAGGGTGAVSFNTNGVVISNTSGTGALAALSLTDGQMVIGSSIGAPAAATLTAGSGITITNGHNSITIAVTSGATVVETLTGNSGGAISPTAGNINTLGTGSITIAGSGSTLTTQLTGLTNHNVLVGAGTATITNVAPSATSGVPLISQGAAADPTFGTAVVAGGGTGSTSFNINGAVYSNTTTTGALQAATLTSGQILIGGTTTPAAATITAGTGISVTNGNNSITIAVASGTAVVQTLTGNSGGAISPTAGNINTLGTGSITIAGSGSTLTTQLTGLTNHNVLIGAGTATITNVAPSATSGVPLISQGSTSDPAFGTAVVAGGGTGATSFNTTGVVISGATSTTALASVTLTDGQLAIGSSAGNPAAATITAGTGITVTNGHNSITIAATGAGFTWADKSTNFNAAASNGYFVTGTTAATLPASPNEGDTIAFIVDDTNILTVTANTGQKIRIGTAISAAAGTAANNARGDALEITYRTVGTTWIANNVVGTWTVT